MTSHDCETYEFTGGISREIPTDPYAYFACPVCGEGFKVRRSNLGRTFPGEDMTEVLEALDGKTGSNR